MSFGLLTTSITVIFEMLGNVLIFYATYFVILQVNQTKQSRFEDCSSTKLLKIISLSCANIIFMCTENLDKCFRLMGNVVHALLFFTSDEQLKSFLAPLLQNYAT